MKMNKSEISRNFWRKIIDNNTIDIKNSDARKSVVKQFLKENKWKATDARFFRLSLSKILREKGINIHTAGLKPEPIRSKSTAGSMSINAKTDEKKIHPLFKTKSFDDTNKDQNVKQPIPTSNQLQPQQDQVSQMSAETVAGIFDSMFNIFCSRYPMCSRLDQQEKISLGESWLPIFSEYFSGQSKWVLPAIVTLPIILKRYAQVSHAKKEEELKKQYGMDKEPEPEPKPEPNKSAWSKMKFGDSTEKK